MVSTDAILDNRGVTRDWNTTNDGSLENMENKYIITEKWKLRNQSYIEKFITLFSINWEDTINLLEEQKEIFWFNLFLLHNENIWNAIKIWIENSRATIEAQKSIFQIPHTYIFWWLFLGVILLAIWHTYLFLPIFFFILSFSVIKIIRIISEKISLLIKTRVFFNISLEEATKIRDDFFYIQPFKNKPQIWKSNTWKDLDWNSFMWKTFLFLFSQPFIFWHLHVFAGVPFKSLFIYDFFIFLIIYGLFEKIIMVIMIIYYKIYFNLLDKYPKYFWKENQKYDFFFDLYRWLIEIIKNINILKKDINDFKSWIINKGFWKWLSDSILSISELLNLMKINIEFMNDNIKFKSFLKNLINEIIQEYIGIFTYLEGKIATIKTGDFSSSSERELVELIIKQNLSNKIEQINIIKLRLNDMKII